MDEPDVYSVPDVSPTHCYSQAYNWMGHHVSYFFKGVSAYRHGSWAENAVHIDYKKSHQF